MKGPDPGLQGPQQAGGLMRVQTPSTAGGEGCPRQTPEGKPGPGGSLVSLGPWWGTRTLPLQVPGPWKRLLSCGPHPVLTEVWGVGFTSVSVPHCVPGLTPDIVHLPFLGCLHLNRRVTRAGLCHRCVSTAGTGLAHSRSSMNGTKSGHGMSLHNHSLKLPLRKGH